MMTRNVLSVYAYFFMNYLSRFVCVIFHYRVWGVKINSLGVREPKA